MFYWKHKEYHFSFLPCNRGKSSGHVTAHEDIEKLAEAAWLILNQMNKGKEQEEKPELNGPALQVYQ